MSIERERAIAAVAARQRTIVTRAQMFAAGFTRSSIADALEARRLHVVYRGIYSLGCGLLPPLAREQAALPACGDGSFLSHATAAALWQMRVADDAEVHVSVVGRPAPARAGICGHTVDRLHPREVRRFDGLPITSPARALLDIAPGLSVRELERAFDAGLAKRVVSAREVRDVLARHPRRRGVARLRKLAEEDGSVTMTRSRAEELFLELVRRAELKPPEVNGRIDGYEVDFVWRRERVVVEIDGFAFHGGRGAFEADRRRATELSATGWIVLRFTWRQLTNQREVVLARLAQTLGSSAPG